MKILSKEQFSYDVASIGGYVYQVGGELLSKALIGGTTARYANVRLGIKGTQALNLLNDSVYIEAAQHFAQRIKLIVPQNASKQISKGYELAFNKSISPEKQKVFEKLYNNAFAKYSQDILKIQQITGDKNAGPSGAALVLVATALLNTDEFLTKN